MLIDISKYMEKTANEKLKNIKKDIFESINSGLLSIDPFFCVNKINIENQFFKITDFENIYLIAFGKAALKMSLAIINKIKIREGIISSNEEVVPLQDKFKKFISEYNYIKEVVNSNTFKETNLNFIENIKFNIDLIMDNLKNITYIKAGHPLPDEKSIFAGNKIIEIAQKAKENDLVFILISGGGSALVENPLIPFETLKSLTSELLKKGANITELNTIRKHLSKIKGGNLAKTCKGKIISFILSDVAGDPIDVIASGPTYYDNSSFFDALNIMKKYDLAAKFDQVRKIFEDGIDGKIPDTLKEKEYFELESKGKIYNNLVGSNYICCKSIINYLIEKNYNTIYLGSLVEGNAEDVAKVFSGYFKSIIKGQFGIMKSCMEFPIAFVWGGETTVVVKGNGKGGRNQHFVLSFLNNIKNIKEILFENHFKQDKYENTGIKSNNKYLFTICSFGTDGIDGVSIAAGAIANNETVDFIVKNNIDLNNILSNSDSYSFFEKLGDAIITGPTGTNVTDIGILLIDKN